MPHICNDLPRFHLLSHCNADTAAMGIQGRESAAVVDLYIVPIAAAPAVSGVGNGHGAVCGSQNRCSLRNYDISPAVIADLTCNKGRLLPHYNYRLFIICTQNILHFLLVSFFYD